MSGSSRESLQDDWKWSGGPLDVREWSGTRPDVRDWSGGPPRCPGVVATPSQMSECNREALPDV